MEKIDLAFILANVWLATFVPRAVQIVIFFLYVVIYSLLKAGYGG